jgi:hypothetical protein
VVLIRVAIVAVIASSACSRTHTAGFWFADGSLTLPEAVAVRLGGPLTDTEIASIEQRSRAEVERAFAGLTISLTASDRTFWRVAVLRSLPRGWHYELPHAGESRAMGLLGGTGAVGFDFVAFQAMHHARDKEARTAIIDGIGRGIGRVAVHEFMHQILGAAFAHNDRDANSYEYGNPERKSQYYGSLHWTSAWPLLQRKLGAAR